MKDINMNKPDQFVLIIGAMKSGTTSLFEILSQHPQICESKVKEPDYFIADKDDASHTEYLNLWDWDKSTHSIALESSVAYTKAPFITGVPKRISNSKLGNFRFIYILREPLSRIESQARHGLFAGWGKSLDLGVSDDLVEFSRYATQIDNYLEYFPKESILLVVLEEFKENPNAVLTRICEFLEVDKTYNFSDVDEVRNPGDFFNARPIVSKITQGGFSQFVIQKLLPAKIKKWLRNLLTKNSKKNVENPSLGRWKLTDKEREETICLLESDLNRLQSQYDIDVKKIWNIPDDIFNKG